MGMAQREYTNSSALRGVSRRAAIWWILAVFVLSRAWARSIGVSFDYDNIEESWQLLDTEILTHHLAEGLWYLHSQPPFFNWLVGMFL